MHDLVSVLSARSEPVLVSLSEDGERLELTGAVLANWVYKSAGLLAELELGPDRALGVVCPPPGALHWRALAAMIAAWSLGSPVHLLVPGSPEPAMPWVGLRPEACPDGDAAEAVDDGSAEEVLVFATAALALRSEAGPGCIDFISAVRAHPDVAALAPRTAYELVDTDGRAAPVVMRDPDADLPAPGSRIVLAGLLAAAEVPALLAALRTGVLVLTDIVDPERRGARAGSEGAIHGTIGAWTK